MSITTVIKHIKDIIVNSGMFNEGLRRWLDYCQKETIQITNFNELEELGILCGELSWQMKKLMHQTLLAADKGLLLTTENEHHASKWHHCQQTALKLQQDQLPDVDMDINVLQSYLNQFLNLA